jgi:ribulose kinase
METRLKSYGTKEIIMKKYLLGMDLGTTNIKATIFDEGGTAIGKGFLFKDTIEPEQVLDPTQTKSWVKLVDMLPDLVNPVKYYNNLIPKLAQFNSIGVKSGSTPQPIDQSINIQNLTVKTNDASNFYQNIRKQVSFA